MKDEPKFLFRTRGESRRRRTRGHAFLFRLGTIDPSTRKADVSKAGDVFVDILHCLAEEAGIDAAKFMKVVVECYKNETGNPQ